MPNARWRACKSEIHFNRAVRLRHSGHGLAVEQAHAYALACSRIVQRTALAGDLLAGRRLPNGLTLTET